MGAPRTCRGDDDVRPGAVPRPEGRGPGEGDARRMSDIFLSYATEDRLRTRILVQVLESRGWSVWWDRTIPPGQTFDSVIERALDDARCAVVLWSKVSVSSDWVKTEAAEAARRRILVPVDRKSVV